MPCIDSHAHLAAWDGEALETILQRAAGAGVETIVDICTDAPSLAQGLELRKRHASPRIVLACATTPHDVAVDGDAFFPAVEAAVGQLAAIGETGLDYHYEHSPRALQQEWLRRYLELAQRHKLPVVIHCRDAFDDFLAIWSEMGCSRGVIHCFTGTLEEAKRCVEQGLLLSLSGIVTFPKSTALQEVARAIPLESLLIETDAPYLAPQPFRGTRNEPAHVVEVARCLASLRGVEVEGVMATTAQTTRGFYGI